jgi:FlaG/FlaF family flagellin (archaellin)
VNMTFLRKILLVSFVLLACTSAYAVEGKTETFSSDTVGVKLDYPSGWHIDTYRWGFSITDPITTSSVSVQTYFMPSELEKAYDINMNEDFSRIYGDTFESVGEGEKEISGLTWDYTAGHGAIGTVMEYEETSYSILVKDTVYSVEKFVLKNTPDTVRKQMDEIVESVRLMYKNSELPLVRNYMNLWTESKDANKEITLDLSSADMSFTYKPPWMFSGAGASTGSVHGY